jgi:hypothetical protein
MERLLKVGARGPDVTSWQGFLLEQKLLRSPADGIFGPGTEDATRRFQARSGAKADGVVGPNTLGLAKKAGFQQTAKPPDKPREAFEPLPPPFKPVTTTAQREVLFGKFDFKAAPTSTNPEAIQILDDWAAKNMVTLTIPQLKGIPYGWGGVSNGKVRFHKKGADALVSLWRTWEQEGLLRFVLTYEGAYEPRLQRGSTKNLSSHAFGSAFDINAQWNGLNKPPAVQGSKGSVVELVALANAHGFYWGGHFATRKDGMHFELASVK